MTMEETEPGQFTGKGTILVMDDDELVRLIAGKTLQSIGYGVDFAEDGTEAVRKYTKSLELGKRYLAVILDLSIPCGMGGKEVLEKLREVDPAVKAFVTSGYSCDPVMVAYERYGFAGAIEKPFGYDDVVNALRTAAVRFPDGGPR